MMAGVHSIVRRVVRGKKLETAALTSGAAEEFAKAYVAGTSIEDAVKVARRLISQGLLVSLAYLPAEDDVTETSAVLIDLLSALGPAARGVEISVKPSTLGCSNDFPKTRHRLDDLCTVAQAKGATVTLEMEGDESFTDTIGLWQALRPEYDTLALTLPADVQRSEREVKILAEPGARLRLCVGAYPVSRGLGYRSEHDKDLAWVRLLRCIMESGAYPMVATHHPTLIAIAQDLARRNNVAPEGFEFQMFYGVRPLEHRRLADIGYQSRTYVPFGPGWFEYITARIVARPRTLLGYLLAIRDKR